jgi:hypothetical protein
VGSPCFFVCFATWLLPTAQTGVATHFRCPEDKDFIVQGSARAVGKYKKILETLFLQLEYTAPDLDADGSKFVADASGPNGPLAYAEPHSLTSDYSRRDIQRHKV